jgi:putative ABC transport system permease protein
VTLADELAASDRDHPSVRLATVTPRLFETLGVRVLSGREFSPQDDAAAPLVVIVNREFAQRHAAKPQDLVGDKLRVRGEERWRQIVGVVGDTRSFSDDEFPPCVYLPHAQEPEHTMFLLARMPEHLPATGLIDALADTDPDVAPYQLQTIDEALRTQVSGDLALFGLFAGLAAVSAGLAAFGLFGVFSYLVTQRSQEFGIRLALGATTTQVGQLIVREGLWTMGSGLAVGIAGGALLSRYAVGVVYGISTDPYDPAVYAVCVVLLLASAAAALWLPIQRAKRVRVTDLLRS